MNDNEEILALHRQLAAERLRADRAETRSDAKSRECIELRERMAAPAAPEQVQAPIAYLHQVVCGDGEPDQALSFEPDNFPLAGTLGYRSISHQALYLAAPSAAAPAAPEQDEVLFDLRDAILDALSRKAAPHAWESLVSETAYRFITERRAMKTATNEGDARDA